jgi:hypothetical protein
MCGNAHTIDVAVRVFQISPSQVGGVWSAVLLVLFLIYISMTYDPLTLLRKVEYST